MRLPTAPSSFRDPFLTPSIPSAEGTYLATESVVGRHPYEDDAVETLSLGDGRTIVAVADGVGGHAAGEVTSSLVLEVLLESLDGGASLETSVELANERVHAVAQDPEKKGLGTTLVILLVDGDRCWVSNVGDSRAHLVSDQGMEQLTRDHPFPTVSWGGLSADPSAWRAFPRPCSRPPAKEGSDDNVTVAIAEFGRVPREDSGDTRELEGDRAFESQDWVGARPTYDRMIASADPSGSYGRAYRQGRVRQGISHIRLWEWSSALNALERATEFDGASALA